MGQCVTKCKNPSSSLGSKSGDPAGKPPGRKAGPVGGAGGGVCREEAGPVCAKPAADQLANGTKKAEAEGRAAPRGGEGPEGEGAEFSVPRIEELFSHYKDEVDDAILEEGMERFCDDLHVDPAEFRVLVLAWKFQAATMCRFTRREFVEGCKALRADSLEGICARFPSMLLEARAEDGFRDLYRFTFQFGLDAELGQRSLRRDIAVALWRLVFTQDSPAILERWLDFLTENPSGVRGISRDTWNMFLNFTQAVGPDLANYSEDEAWPSLFDTFVEWEVERRRREWEGPGPEDEGCGLEGEGRGLEGDEQGAPP